MRFAEELRSSIVNCKHMYETLDFMFLFVSILSTKLM